MGLTPDEILNHEFTKRAHVRMLPLGLMPFWIKSTVITKHSLQIVTA